MFFKPQHHWGCLCLTIANELYFPYFLVIVYFCVPGKGAHCFQMVSPIIDLCSALGEGLTWELTNSSYSDMLGKAVASFRIVPVVLSFVCLVWFGFFLPSFLWCIFLLCPNEVRLCFAFGADIIPPRPVCCVVTFDCVHWLPGRELSWSHIQILETFAPRRNWTKCKLAKKDEWVSSLITVQFSFSEAFTSSSGT